MKGAYIVRLDLEEPHLLGVARKIRAQVAALLTTVSEMDLYFLNSGKIMQNDTMLRRYGVGPVWRRVTYYFMFYLFLARQNLAVDFVYIRYQRSSPVFLYMLYRLKSHHPGLVILVELPSFPYHTENTSVRDSVLGFVDRLSRPFLHRYVDRIVTFSRETEIFGIPTIRTDNGVDVENLELSPVPHETQVIRLVGVANLSFWHGYDRIIAGLAEYYASDRKRKVKFDIVGSGGELERLQKDARQAGLSDKVKFLGPKHGSQLDELIGQSHIGVSSIGMHRLDVDTSNLKSREFCARGIPFIIAYEDRDFGKELPFIFHAPANDDPIDIEELLGFYDRIRTTQPDFPRDMRNYAEKQLTWQAKMAPVVASILDLLSEQNKSIP